MDAYLRKFLHKFQHLEIQLEEIKSATDNFNDKNCIGVGGFGKVYKGEVSHYKGRSMVAIKRLGGSSSGQGTPEFLKEITTLSRYSHENLISLLGFCYQGQEMILVYEHASRGSFERYLNSPHLTWSQRLKICIGAAKGLRYLHDPGETHQRLIHCDIKSSNILLDDQWNAKVSDLGLSIAGSANEQQSVIVTLAAGTIGYIDPLYMMTHTLTKESDVYSFGVFLFEVLCGRLCYTYSNGNTKILVPNWIESYEQRKLNDIIFKNPTTESLDQDSIKIFSDIAYRCLNESREDRPKMSEVVTDLETALDSLEFSERNPLFDYEELAKSAVPPLNYRSKFELWKLLMEGVFLNDGKTLFSLNKKGEHCERVSIADCLHADTHKFLGSENSRWDHITNPSPRFDAGTYNLLFEGKKYKLCVKTQFLTPGITYTMSISCRIRWSPDRMVSFEYKLEGETETSKSYIASYRTDDTNGWGTHELYQFTSDQRDHEFLFELEADYLIVAESIDLKPLEEVEHTTDEQQPLSDSDSEANWEENLPADYKDIMKESKDIMHWTTKKEAYSLLRKGFLVNNGKEWFSLDKYGKKCIMLSPRAAFETFDDWSFLSLPESRFWEGFQCDGRMPDIKCHVRKGPISSISTKKATYVVFLVYKIPNGLGRYPPVPVSKGLDDASYRYNFNHILLEIPETPVIRTKACQNTHNPMNKLPKIKGIPRQRDDGWMEVQIGEYQVENDGGIFLKFVFFQDTKGLIVQGVEVRFI